MIAADGGQAENASGEMCLALLLFAEVGVGALAFAVVDRRSRGRPAFAVLTSAS